MKIVEVQTLSFPEIKVIRFERFKDQRGYFTEIYRKEDFEERPDLSSLNKVTFVQANVSYSKEKTIRGLHFQWNPYMGKLVRVVEGKMLDLVLDIRKNSPTFGKIIVYGLNASFDADYDEWIWIPKGFAHGSVYLKGTLIEYFCDAAWSPDSEASISPLAKDIDWSLVDPGVKKQITGIINNNPLISDKDKNGFTIEQWKNSPESNKFTYSS